MFFIKQYIGSNPIWGNLRGNYDIIKKNQKFFISFCKKNAIIYDAFYINNYYWSLQEIYKEQWNYISYTNSFAIEKNFQDFSFQIFFKKDDFFIFLYFMFHFCSHYRDCNFMFNKFFMFKLEDPRGNCDINYADFSEVYELHKTFFDQLVLLPLNNTNSFQIWCNTVNDNIILSATIFCEELVNMLNEDTHVYNTYKNIMLNKKIKN